MCYNRPVAAGRRKAAPNAVRDAVQKVGGMVAACSLLGVSYKTLERWTRAGAIPSLEPAVKLAKAAGVPVERFVGKK
jgi:hypothetical protein